MESSEWHPYVRQYGFYDPIMVGSIDGTDDTPHDRAIKRALSSDYHWKLGSSGFRSEDFLAIRFLRDQAKHVRFIIRRITKCTVFIGRLPYFTDKDCLRNALLNLLDSRSESPLRHRNYQPSSSSRIHRSLRSRSRSPFAQSAAPNSDKSEWPQIHIVNDFVSGYPCGYAFACFAEPEHANRLLRNWFRSTSTATASSSNANDCPNSRGSAKRLGLNIPNGEKVILEPAFGGTLPGWKPRRLGGGLGGRKEAGQLRFGGVARPFRRPFHL